MPKISEELNNLSKADTFSLVLFALYKLKDTKEYSTVSELAYILDENSLLKLCEYFGGVTITIPTVDELKVLVNALLLYCYVEIDKKPYNEATKLVGCPPYMLRKVKAAYAQLSRIMGKYTISV